MIVSADGYDTSDPSFIKEHRDTITARYALDIGTYIARFGDPSGTLLPSRDIEVPVLVGMGIEDLLFCGHELGNDCTNAQTLRTSVAPSFPKAPLDTFVLPNAGHALNLALNASDWFLYSIAWSQEVVA